MINLKGLLKKNASNPTKNMNAENMRWHPDISFQKAQDHNETVLTLLGGSCEDSSFPGGTASQLLNDGFLSLLGLRSKSIGALLHLDDLFVVPSWGK